MGSVTTIVRTPTTQTSQAAASSAATTTTPAKEPSSPAMATNIQSTKVKDVSSFLFNQMIAGEICRFGDGWLTRCPECSTLIVTSGEFKTFSMKNKETWRLAPSLSCPSDDCDWHRSVVIEPEEDIEMEEAAGEETEEAEATTEATATEGAQA